MPDILGTPTTTQKLKSGVVVMIKFILPKFIYNYLFESYYGYKTQKLLNRFSGEPFGVKNHESNRIQYFISSLRPGGAERQLVNTVLGLPKKKWDLAVNCEFYESEEDRFYGPLLEKRGIPVQDLAHIEFNNEIEESDYYKKVYEYFTGQNRGKLSGFEKSLAPYVVTLLNSRPHIVHAWLDLINIRAGLAALITGVPKIILGQRNVAPDNFLLYTPVLRPGYLALANSPRVTLLNNSKGGALDYCRWLKLGRERIRVLPNGVRFSGNNIAGNNAMEFRQKYSIPPDASVVGSVFRFNDEKRPLFWIEIARKILDLYPDVYFILVGEGILRKKAVAYVKKLKFTDRIRFTGLMDDPMPAIRAMDVFILSSRKEGLPNVLIEAQSAGIPVLTPDVGGAAETLWMGKTGYALKNATVSSMADKAVEILRDTEWRESARKYGPAFIADKFSMDKMIRDLETIYQD